MFDFKDINLIPKLCIVESRSQCDTSISFGKIRFGMPIVPANMECVINESLCEKLCDNNFFYILHRFGNTLEFCRKMKKLKKYISISTGVNTESYNILSTLKDEGIDPDYITIDIAHGHSISVKNMINFIKQNFTSFIIAGNVSTPESIIEIESWGADAIKVGIGPGSACTTYPSTGFGSRNCQAFIINECSKVAKKPIIADGGIKEPGDISKAIAMGASMVMIGGMLSGYEDSPGNVIEYNNMKYKEFWGSASEYQSSKKDRIEGKKILIDYREKSLIEEYKHLQECLQSSISYGGGKDISCLYNVKWINH